MKSQIKMENLMFKPILKMPLNNSHLKKFLLWYLYNNIDLNKNERHR